MSTYGSRRAHLASHVVLIAACLVTLLPLFWVARTSLVSKIAAYTIPPDWTAPLSLESYRTVIFERRFAGYFANSLIISLVSASLAVTIGAFVSYGLVRTRRRTGGLKLAILSGQLFPRIVLIIPLYVLVRSLGGLDTYWVFVVGYLAFLLPAAVAVLLPYLDSVPVELEEAAMIDGASRPTVLRRIVLPLAMPGVSAGWMFAFVLGWNEFLFPLFLGGRTTRTLTVGISAFVTQRGVDIGPTAAATMIAVLPALAIGLLARRSLVEGITSGGVRG